MSDDVILQTIAKQLRINPDLTFWDLKRKLEECGFFFDKKSLLRRVKTLKKI